jgi:quinoprotein glucose dehydrogenase
MPGNVAGLQVAWEYASGGVDTLKNNTQIQCNPLIIDGVLYGVSAGSQAFALDAATGKQLWETAFTDDTFAMNSRGVTYWTDGQEARIFFAYGSLLYALDARTGKPVVRFGKGGKINLKEGLARPGADEYVVSNTPGVVYENLLIMGHRVSEIAPALPGDVRAYDLRTGRLVWTFHTIPHPGEYGTDTWPKDGYRNFGGANNWMGMAIDRQRGIVYVPTGTAAFDLYGSTRPGQNLFCNSLIALDAATGKRRWHFQTIHHDIWDRDIPAPPNLFTVVHAGKKVDAVSVLSKQGFLFVFDRVTGQPLFPIKERAMPASSVPGEKAWPTQPIPLKPAPFTRQSFSESDMNEFVTDRDTCAGPAPALAIREGVYSSSPESQSDRVFPRHRRGRAMGRGCGGRSGHYVRAGQANSGYYGAGSDPRSVRCQPRLVERTGSQLYQTHCGACHGQNREGSHDGTYPALISISQKRNETSVAQVLAKGQGMMPAFTHLKEAERKAIVDFLFGKTTSVASQAVLNTAPYHHTGFTRWYDRAGYPVSRPPWGTLRRST